MNTNNDRDNNKEEELLRKDNINEHITDDGIVEWDSELSTTTLKDPSFGETYDEDYISNYNYNSNNDPDVGLNRSIIAEGSDEEFHVEAATSSLLDKNRNNVYNKLRIDSHYSASEDFNSSDFDSLSDCSSNHPHYSDLSPTERKQRSRQKRNNRTNEFADSIMARPLWKDEITLETKQQLHMRRELEKLYQTKTYVLDRYGGYKDTKKVNDEKKALFDKYTELSKRIVSPTASKKKEDKDSISFFRRFKYHDDIVKDRNELIVAKERERAVKIQQDIETKKQEEELRKRQEKEEIKRKRLDEMRKRESHKQHLHTIAGLTKSTRSPSKRITDVKIHYPKPKVAKLTPQKEAELMKLEQKRQLLEKRQKLMAPSQKALKEAYKAPKVLFLREIPKQDGPKPRKKYVPPPPRRPRAKKRSPQKEQQTSSPESISDRIESVLEIHLEDLQEVEKDLTIDDAPEIYVESEHRMRILAEILSTERTYVKLLGEIFELYADPIVKSGLLPADIYRLVFNDLRVILLLNQEFLQELEITHEQYLKDVESNSASALFGNLFKKRSPTFKLYTNYINNYEQALHVIEEQSEKNRGFKHFRQNVSRRLIDSNSHNTDISSYMILPVQRIPRYQLLLKDLVKHTPIDHPEYSDLVEAHDFIADIASYCNTKKAEAINIFKVIELAEELKLKDLVQPGRNIVKEGEVRRAKSRKLTKLYLFNDIMVIVEKGLLNKIIQIPLPASNGENAIEVYAVESTEGSGPDSELSCRMEFRAAEFAYQRNFVCDSKEDRDEWLRLLENTQKALIGHNNDSRSPKKKGSTTIAIPKKGFIQIFSP